MNIIEQRDPEEFVYPQDIATGVGPDARMMRYGGITKREWVATMLAARMFPTKANPTSMGPLDSPDFSDIIKLADALLEQLNKPAEPEAYPLTRGD